MLFRSDMLGDGAVGASPYDVVAEDIRVTSFQIGIRLHDAFMFRLVNSAVVSNNGTGVLIDSPNASTTIVFDHSDVSANGAYNVRNTARTTNIASYSGIYQAATTAQFALGPVQSATLVDTYVESGAGSCGIDASDAAAVTIIGGRIEIGRAHV